MIKDNMIKPKIVPITIPAIVPFVKWWNDKDDDELPLSDSTEGFNDDGAILASVGINDGSSDGSRVNVGSSDGSRLNVGSTDGSRLNVGMNVGSKVGSNVGSDIGTNDGGIIGAKVGGIIGAKDGGIIGLKDGRREGSNVGMTVGSGTVDFSDGSWVNSGEATDGSVNDCNFCWWIFIIISVDGVFNESIFSVVNT